MLEPSKPRWPKTPEGTIDWEKVFEHPDNGLMARISATDTRDKLHETTADIIRKLFTRKNDETEVTRFLGDLDTIMAGVSEGDDLSVTRDAVLDLMRRVKEGRITRAKAYVDKKKADRDGKKAGAERRSGFGGGIGDVLFGSRVRIAVTASVSLLFTLVLVGFLWLLDIVDFGPSYETVVAGEGITSVAPEPEKKEPDAVQVLAPQAVVVDPVRAAIEEFSEFVMVLKPVNWPVNMGGGKSRKNVFLPVLGISSGDEWSTICKKIPNLMDAVNLALSRGLPKDRKAVDADFLRADQLAGRLMNERLGANLVVKISMWRNPGKKIVALGMRCRVYSRPKPEED